MILPYTMLVYAVFKQSFLYEGVVERWVLKNTLIFRT